MIETTKKIGENWKKLSADEKKPYEALQVKDRLRYDD